MRSKERMSWKGGVIAGVAAGLVGAWVMNRFQDGLSALLQKDEKEPSHDDNATVRAASAISETLLDRPLQPEEKPRAGALVHYVFGSAVGAVSGGLAEAAPSAAGGWGLPFGTALWLGADEIAVPALGLSRPTTEFPASVHASTLAAHLVYGLTTDAVRRAIRFALSG
jgi:putative membrane protein